MHGAVFLQSPPVLAFDQRELFCVYLYPGSEQNRKVGYIFHYPLAVFEISVILF